jgi:hypothetical protein
MDLTHQSQQSNWLDSEATAGAELQPQRSAALIVRNKAVEVL